MGRNQPSTDSGQVDWMNAVEQDNLDKVVGIAVFCLCIVSVYELLYEDICGLLAPSKKEQNKT